MGSKVSEDKNEIRPKIANYIRIHPGTSFKTIKTIFELSDSTLRYHLRYLEKKGKIRTNGNKRVYYPVEYHLESDLNKTQLKLINTIKKHPGITQKELSKKAKINRLTIRNNINLLVLKEIISLKKEGKEIHHYYIHPGELENIKTKKIITKFLLGMIDEETYWDLRGA
jgi:predicted transcriptional regulator